MEVTEFMCNIFEKDENGFTGLEAAIVMIAFFVVAAALSYMIVSEGLFTNQRNNEVAHSSVEQASSSLVLSGDINVEGRNNVIDASMFCLKNTAGGTPVDLNRTIITYTDKDDFVTKDYASSAWSYIPLNNKNIGATNLVEDGDIYRIAVNFTSFNLTSLPGTNEVVKLEIKPALGVSLIIQRKMPTSITSDPVICTNYMIY
jgi:flagellin FlaB